jgi:hypothetical protein
MVEACMDESGIHDGAHVCVIGGYWGSTNKWKRFEPRWKQIIKDADEPTLKEFHSTKFWYSDGRRKGMFAKWSDDKADQFISDLANCIVQSKLFPTSAVLVAAEFKKRTKDERMWLTGGRYHLTDRKWIATGAPNRLYFLPFQFAIEYPALQCSAGLHVHYVFDLNKQFKIHALDLFHRIKNDPKVGARHRMGSLDFETSDKAIGLQAADLLAYQVYQFSKERMKTKVPSKLASMPPLLRKLITNMREHMDFPFLDKYGIDVLLHDLLEELRGPAWERVEIRSSPRRIGAPH